MEKKVTVQNNTVVNNVTTTTEAKKPAPPAQTVQAQNIAPKKE